MATNADDTNGEENQGADDTQKTTEEDLRNLKYGESEVETSSGDTDEDETTGSDDSEEESEEAGEEDGQTDDDTEEAEDTEDSGEFVKELPNIKGDTVADYARNLEKAYQESTKEALRLKNLADSNQTQTTKTDDKSTSEIDISNPLELYAKQKMDNEIAEAFQAFQKEYPQAVPGSAEYNAFTNEVAVLSNTILQSQKRLASPQELYTKAAVILGWEKDSAPTGKEKLGMALKGQSAVSKTSSSTKIAPKSKVTAEMIAFNKKLYPDKSEDQLRKELEPFVK